MKLKISSFFLDKRSFLGTIFAYLNILFQNYNRGIISASSHDC